MIRRTRPIRISLGDVPAGSTSRRIPTPKPHEERMNWDPKLNRPTSFDMLGDMSAADFTQQQRLKLGGAPRRYYVNKSSAWFFTELDKGTRSPWVVGAYLICAALACRRVYQLFYAYVYEEREYKYAINPDSSLVSSIPFQESHNMAMGLRNKHRPNTTADYAGANELSNNAIDENSVQPPRLIYTEKSETVTNKDESPVDMVIIERREYDKATNRDAVYRMAQYIYDDDVQEAGEDAKALKKLDKDVTAFERKKRDWLNSLPMVRRQERARPDHVHAMVKCKGIDATTQNCVTSVGDAQIESTRKILLGLGPVHLLRDVEKIEHRKRVTEFKEFDTNILLMGLHGGELPTALKQFSNFKIDVVEKDPSMIRIARNFFGFKETSQATLTMSDPLAYIRRLASIPEHKRYDFVIVDALDGKGRLAPNYSRLEFVDGVRNVMEKAGVVAVNIPNDDAQYYLQCLQNWRTGFDNRLMILSHCASTQNTVLFAFQDDADRGKVNMGSCGSPAEFGDILNTFLTYYRGKRDGSGSFAFDLKREVDPYFFTILSAGQRLELANLLPPNHPALRDPKYLAKMGGAAEGGASGGYFNPAGSNAYDRGTMGVEDHTRTMYMGHKSY